MKNTFTGILAGILLIICLILIFVIAWSLFGILQNPLPPEILNNNGLNGFLQIFQVPILTTAALLYVITLLFTVFRIQQVNNSLILLKEEIYSTEKPRLFLKSSKITFSTEPIAGKLDFKFNGDLSPLLEIINAGKEPALEVRVKFIFDYSGSIKLIKANDLFHIFNIKETEDEIELTSDKIGYSSIRSLAFIKNWQKTSFVLSPSINPLPPRISFPDVYLELFYWFNEITNGDKTNEFPELKCNVEHMRLDAAKIAQTFRISFRELNYSPGLRGDKLYDSVSVFATSIEME